MINLPLIEYTKSLYPSACLKGTCILAIQHLLETTHTMFDALFSFGLKPQDIRVLGKCYSTNSNVALRMRASGIYVSPLSTRYDSHNFYDETLGKNAVQFLEESFKNTQYDRYVILDDGGELLASVIKHFKQYVPRVVGIEQTSSGIERLKQNPLPLPVINIAHSFLKKSYEPAWITSLALNQIIAKTGPLSSSKHLLIMGNGALGAAFSTLLEHSCHVTMYEKKDPHKPSLDEILPQVDMIIGCTGATSIPRSKHHLLKKKCVLVSASSSDREFDSVHLRRQLPRYTDCFLDLTINDIQLLNSGFPINFTGQEHSVSPEKIQLTRALLFAGILQASQLQTRIPSFINLDDQVHYDISAYFSSLYTNNLLLCSA